MEKCRTIERMLQISSQDRARASHVVARSFYRMLRRNGFSQSEIMTFTGQILDEVIKDLKANGKDLEKPADRKSWVSRDSMEVI